LSNPLSPSEGVEKHLFAVLPSKAGIPKHLKPVDSCLRRNDGKVEILRFSKPSLGERKGLFEQSPLPLGERVRVRGSSCAWNVSQCVGIIP